MNLLVQSIQAEIVTIRQTFVARRMALATSALAVIEAEEAELHAMRARIDNELVDLEQVRNDVHKFIESETGLRPSPPQVVTLDPSGVVFAIAEVMHGQDWMTTREIVERVKARYQHKWQHSAIEQGLYIRMQGAGFVESKPNDRMDRKANSKLWRLKPNISLVES